MRTRIAFTDDKIVRWCISQFAEIQLNDIFAFFVAYSLNNCMIEVFDLRFFCPPCWYGCQNSCIQVKCIKIGQK